MRYLIDTNIFVYLALDIEMLSRDVKAILEEPDTLLYISAESVRELIVGYRNKGLCSKRWKTVEEMVAAIENEFYVQILPVKKEHMATYARMEINEAQGHKDRDIKTRRIMSSSPMPLPSGCPSSPATPASGSIAAKGLT